LLSDLPESQQRTWRLVAQLTANDPVYSADRSRRAEIRRLSGLTWIDRVAGALHREYVPGRSAEALLHSLIGFCRLGRTIDIGAGDGSLALLLAQATDDLLLLEPNEAMRCAGTQRLSALPQARYLAAQAEAIPLPDASRDSALMIQSLQYMQDPEKALAEAQRVLVPGGRLLVLTLAKHEADEAHRFGHRHLGFSAEDLQTWTPQLCQQSVVLLQPESRPPRFIPLVFTGLKRG
jgi:ArsR family transcriptional regulator